MIPAKKENAVLALHTFLKVLKAPVTKTTTEQVLTRHPHYPSFLSVSDSLNEWKIEHATARLKPEQLGEVPTPFFTHLTTEGGLFTVVTAVSAAGVRWWHTQKGWQQEPQSEFLKKWAPVVLLAELSDTSGESDFLVNHRKERVANWRRVLLWATLLLALGLLILLVFNPIAGLLPRNWHVLLFTKLAGTGVSLFLLGHIVDKHSPGSSLCQFHKTVDCRAVLTSKAATLWGWISWSEIGFFYFSGGGLALAIGFDNAFVKAFLWMAGFLTLPYILFSVYYQARVVRKWCLWCLIVQCLFLVEAVLLFPYKPILDWDPGGATILGLAFLLPVMGWTFVQPLLKAATRIKGLTNELNQFRTDPQVFSLLLNKQEKMPPLPKPLQPIQLGNPLADDLITMVLNPYCEPCAKAYAEMKNILEVHEQIGCQVLFATSNGNNDPRAIFVRRLFTIPAHQRAEALRVWYERNDTKFLAWSHLVQTSENEPCARWQVDLYHEWNLAAALMFTPTFYVNDRRLPALYQLSDLPYLLKYSLPTRSVTKESTPTLIAQR